MRRVDWVGVRPTLQTDRRLHGHVKHLRPQDRQVRPAPRRCGPRQPLIDGVEIHQSHRRTVAGGVQQVDAGTVSRNRRRAEPLGRYLSTGSGRLQRPFHGAHSLRGWQMFQNDLLDLAIGLVFVWFILSLVVSVVNEGFVLVFRIRAKHLWLGIGRLVNPRDGRYARRLWDSVVSLPLSSLAAKQTRRSPTSDRGIQLWASRTRPSAAHPHRRVFRLRSAPVNTSQPISGRCSSASMTRSPLPSPTSRLPGASPSSPRSAVRFSPSPSQGRPAVCTHPTSWQPPTPSSGRRTNRRRWPKL